MEGLASNCLQFARVNDSLTELTKLQQSLCSQGWFLFREKCIFFNHLVYELLFRYSKSYAPCKCFMMLIKSLELDDDDEEEEEPEEQEQEQEEEV